MFLIRALHWRVITTYILDGNKDMYFCGSNNESDDIKKNLQWGSKVHKKEESVPDSEEERLGKPSGKSGQPTKK